MPARRSMAALAAALFLLAVVPGVALAATEATSSASAEERLVGLINDRRAEAGVPPMTPRADLHAAARDWSFSQAERAVSRHNPDLTTDVCCWTKIAENVAVTAGPTDRSADSAAAMMFAMWRDSDGHDRNMTDPDLDQVGIGVVVDDDGTAWGTAVFRRCDGSSCSGGAQGPQADRTLSWAPAPEEPPEPSEPATASETTPAPAPQPSPSPSPSPRPTPSASPSPSPRPSPTPRPRPSPTPLEVTPLRAVAVNGEPEGHGDVATAAVVLGAILAAAGTVAARRRR